MKTKLNYLISQPPLPDEILMRWGKRSFSWLAVSVALFFCCPLLFPAFHLALWGQIWRGGRLLLQPPTVRLSTLEVMVAWLWLATLLGFQLCCLAVVVELVTNPDALSLNIH